MSMSMLLIPLAVALCVTASDTVEAIRESCVQARENSKTNADAMRTLRPVQTRFNDAALLHKTLVEHGLDAQLIDTNNLVVTSNGGMLRYTRQNANDSFVIRLEQIANVDCLINDLDELEHEYDSNVQAFTYNRIIQNLPEDMSIVEDTVLEDDSLLLRLAVN